MFESTYLLECHCFFRASAYDVFAPSILSSATGMNANPSSRRSSFRVAAPESSTYKENSPSPEKTESTLLIEEDRRLRRRGSQLYAIIYFIHFFRLSHHTTHSNLLFLFLLILLGMIYTDLISVQLEIEQHFLLPIQIN